MFEASHYELVSSDSVILVSVDVVDSYARRIVKKVTTRNEAESIVNELNRDYGRVRYEVRCVYTCEA
jgi:hypothetical protein